MDADLQIVTVFDQLGRTRERERGDQFVDELAGFVANLSWIHWALLLSLVSELNSNSLRRRWRRLPRRPCRRLQAKAGGACSVASWRSSDAAPWRHRHCLRSFAAGDRDVPPSGVPAPGEPEREPEPHRATGRTGRVLGSSTILRTPHHRRRHPVDRAPDPGFLERACGEFDPFHGSWFLFLLRARSVGARRLAGRCRSGVARRRGRTVLRGSDALADGRRFGRRALLHRLLGVSDLLLGLGEQSAATAVFLGDLAGRVAGGLCLAAEGLFALVEAGA